ncbi:MAG: GntR family transcriptional regulator, partial [Lachnospiraceae bacterium]|nr:GntR family transcriptional regulator [Lachnospiraceae bacterium]
MVIAIREGSEIPIYQQIRDQIVQGISDGRLELYEQLPTVRALAEEIGINSMTVNKAYQLLKQQGYIMADRRSGARVCKSFAKAPQLSFESREQLCVLAAEAKIGGMTQEEFLNECRRCYEGSSQKKGDSQLPEQDGEKT